MNLFEVMDDEWAIVRSKGVFKQVKVYRRGKRLFVAHGSGFAALKKPQSTFYRFGTTVADLVVEECTLSSEGVSWEGISSYATISAIPSSDGTVRKLREG